MQRLPIQYLYKRTIWGGKGREQNKNRQQNVLLTGTINNFLISYFLQPTKRDLYKLIRPYKLLPHLD